MAEPIKQKPGPMTPLENEVPELEERTPSGRTHADALPGQGDQPEAARGAADRPPCPATRRGE